MEITINDTAYQFNFGMGFMREINKRVCTQIDGLKGVSKNIGLNYYASGLLDNDMEALAEVLYTANIGCNPRITMGAIDAYLDDSNTDIPALFDSVMGFLRTSNATKTAVNQLVQNVEAAMQNQN